MHEYITIITNPNYFFTTVIQKQSVKQTAICLAVSVIIGVVLLNIRFGWHIKALIMVAAALAGGFIGTAVIGLVIYGLARLFKSTITYIEMCTVIVFAHLPFWLMFWATPFTGIFQIYSIILSIIGLHKVGKLGVRKSIGIFAILYGIFIVFFMAFFIAMAAAM